MSDIISVNQLIQDHEGRVYRVVGIDDMNGKVFLFDLNKGIQHLMIKDSDLLEQDVSGNVLRVVEEIYKSNITGRQLSEYENKASKKAWDIIQRIYDLAGGIGIFDKHIRSNAIKETSVEFKTSERTIREYLRRYFERGMIRDSLIPDNKNSGRRPIVNSSSNTEYEDKKISDAKGIKADENLQRIFSAAINKYYNNSKKVSLRTAYELMIKEYFSTIEIGEDGMENINIMMPNLLPTFHQFRYWHYKNRDIRNELIGREGLKNYNLKNRAVLFNTIQETIGPGSLFQIDATLADFYLVSSYNKLEVVGRPTLYLVLDVFTRMICGVSVTLRQPSYISAAMAILNASQDKQEFCEEYGIDIVPSEWPCRNLPITLLGDRGELEGSDIENVVARLGVRVSNTSSYRGDLKPIVERYIGLLQDTIKPFLTGVIKEDFQKRGAPDYRTTASLDIFQFTKIIIKTIIYFNNNYLPGYERNESMVRDGVAPIPTRIWEWSINNHSGRLKHIDEDILKFYLLPRDRAKVTMKGIEYKGIRYVCDKALNERWFEKAREKGSWKVDIMYDPRMSNYIYILDKESEGFLKCTFINKSSRYLNKSFYDVDYLIDKEKQEKVALEHNKLQSKVELISEIEEIVDESISDVKYHKKSMGIKKVRLIDIKENRTREKLIEDSKNAFRPVEQIKEEDVKSSKNSSKKEPNDISEDFLRIQEEMLDDR